jgi:hypothetical protein
MSNISVTMTSFVTLLSSGMFLAACQHDRTTPAPAATTTEAALRWQVPSEAGVAVRPTCPGLEDDAFFFPVASLGCRAPGVDHDLSRRKWYSQELRRMLEPSLSCGQILQSTFRFTLLRTFHPPVTIRISFHRSSGELAATEMSGSGGVAPAATVDQPHRNLSLDESTSVQRALARAQFWELPSWRDGGGLDGSQWIVEGRVLSRYHVVDRWSPQSDPFRDLGLLFIKLSGLSIPEQDVY